MPRSPFPALTVLATALSWAIVAATAHVASVEFRVRALHGFSMTPPLFQLTAPVAYVILFVVIAIPFAVAARLRWRFGGVAAVNAFFAGLAAFSILLLYRRIHPLAFVVVAIGFGWQVGQWMSRHPAGFARFSRRMAPCLAVLLAINGLVPPALTLWREGSVLDSSRTTPADAPNVLLLILDTVRAANLGMYGYTRATSPALDALARDGAVFEHAYSTASWSLPSHASMLTGVWAHETGGTYLRRMRDDLPTVTGVLADNGYVTAAFSGNGGWAGHETGLPRGFHRYTTYRSGLKPIIWNTSLTQTSLALGVINGIVTRRPKRIFEALREFDLRANGNASPGLRRADEITEAFLTWRDKVNGRHPWFAMLNVFDAHDPYITPFERHFDGGSTNLDKYDGAIAYIDSIVGNLFETLESRGDLERTLVIVTSDHGEKFGEHGEFQHSGGLYLPVLHVPLVLRYPPAFPAGTRRAELRTTADIPETILDVVGVSEQLLPGKSLVQPRVGDPLLLSMSNRRINPPPDDPTAGGDIFGALTNEWHYIRFAGREELYRWRVDPTESNNLAASAEGQAVLPVLRNAIKGIRGTS